MRFKMQLKIERDRQDDIRLLTLVFANLAPYMRAISLVLDLLSWSDSQLLDLVQYMGKSDEGLQFMTIVSHLQVHLPSDHFTATLSAMRASMRSAYAYMWGIPDPVRYLSSICAAMSGAGQLFAALELPAFATDGPGQQWSMATLPSWTFLENPRAVASLCCAWGTLTSLQPPYTMPFDLKTCLAKPLAAAIALKRLTYSHMFSHQSCVLQPPKDFRLEQIILEDPCPSRRYGLNEDLMHCMMRAKCVSIRLLDHDVACLWQENIFASKIPAIHGPSTVELFEWTIPHFPGEDEVHDGPWEISGSAKGEHAFSDGWDDMLLHLRDV
jgi:hypothetical protein